MYQAIYMNACFIEAHNKWMLRVEEFGKIRIGKFGEVKMIEEEDGG